MSGFCSRDDGRIAKEESKTVRPVLFESFEKYQVQLLTGTKVTAITANSVEAENAEGKVSLPCDYVVLAVGARPNLFDAQALEDKRRTGELCRRLQ